MATERAIDEDRPEVRGRMGRSTPPPEFRGARSETKLEWISQELKTALDGLGSITRTGEVTFEGGLHRWSYLRPTNALKAQLHSTREVLVVVTPFDDVQVRTVKFIAQRLLDSDGRLEPSLAMVFHCDFSGDEKLVQWGRERGLTILPVSVLSGIPTGADLQYVLNSSLFALDPFDLTGPVRSTHQFFGRTDIPDLARRLRDGHVQAFFGIRKIGKTSVLNRVLGEAMAHHSMNAVMLDCSDDSLSSLSSGQLLSAIFGATCEVLESPDLTYAIVLPLTVELTAAEAANEMIVTLEKQRQSLLLVLDEVDYITPSSPTNPRWDKEFNPFFRALRRVYQECARRDVPFSLLIGGVSSHWFSVDMVAGVENSALSLVPEGYLPPLSRQESVHMITTLGASAGLLFDSTSATAIAETCSDIPFWIRKACSFVGSCYPSEDRPVKIAMAEVSLLLEEFIEVEGQQLAYSSLHHLLTIYPDLQGPALLALDGDDVSTANQRHVSALGRYGLLTSEHALSGPMVAAGLRQLRDELRSAEPIASSPETVDLTVESGATLDGSDLSQLLAEVSVRRNDLEQDMRDFVQAVIRLECAQKSDGRAPIEVILAALPADRRAALRGLNMRSLARKLYWLDLMSLIKKNWGMFDKYFGDRKQFELHGEIVNDRPDAHAKEIDQADLALQRRSIGWISDRVMRAGVL